MAIASIAQSTMLSSGHSSGDNTLKVYFNGGFKNNGTLNIFPVNYLLHEIGSADSTIYLNTNILFPNSGVVTIEDEQIRYTSIGTTASGDYLTGCTRGVNSTVAASHAGGLAVKGPIETVIYTGTSQGTPCTFTGVVRGASGTTARALTQNEVVESADISVNLETSGSIERTVVGNLGINVLPRTQSQYAKELSVRFMDAQDSQVTFAILGVLAASTSPVAQTAKYKADTISHMRLTGGIVTFYWNGRFFDLCGISRWTNVELLGQPIDDRYTYTLELKKGIPKISGNI